MLNWSWSSARRSSPRCSLGVTGSSGLGCQSFFFFFSCLVVWLLCLGGVGKIHQPKNLIFISIVLQLQEAINILFSLNRRRMKEKHCLVSNASARTFFFSCFVLLNPSSGAGVLAKLTKTV